MEAGRGFCERTEMARCSVITDGHTLQVSCFAACAKGGAESVGVQKPEDGKHDQ